jgi:glycosyltransferase involved in cell wall biosynthesis
MGGDVEDLATLTPDDVRGRWSIPKDAPLVLYTGTLEAYQGVELLVRAAGRLARSRPAVRVLLVGGEPAQVERMRGLATEAGAAGAIAFAGQQPAREIPSFVAAADLLVSPRIRGTNTPLKIYSYLRSGKPIVATNLRTHTQVLDNRVARLVEPDESALATAIAELVDRPDERDRLGSAARQLAADRYSRASYIRRTAEAYAQLTATPRTRRAESTKRARQRELAGR